MGDKGGGITGEDNEKKGGGDYGARGNRTTGIFCIGEKSGD